MTTFADCASTECKGITIENSSSDSSICITCQNSGSDTLAQTLLRNIDPHPFVPAGSEAIHERCEEIINIQVAALAKRLDAICCHTLTVGISGGLDSTLALLIAVRTFDRLASRCPALGQQTELIQTQ